MIFFLLSQLGRLTEKVICTFLLSGGHINPAVSLAMVVCGRLNIRKLPFYFIGQFLGSLIASAICFGVYKGKPNVTQSLSDFSFNFSSGYIFR